MAEWPRTLRMMIQFSIQTIIVYICYASTSVIEWFPQYSEINNDNI